MLRIQKRYPVVLTVHDECCVLAPEGEGEEAYAFMLECMTKAPAWAPDLPLKADGGWGSRYGDVK
jgi:DNA polymerase I-like protein with 3'-5' exonuclease and polymerase domains